MNHRLRYLNQQNLAAVLGITARAVRDFPEGPGGIPIDRNRKSLRYPVPEAVDWYYAKKYGSEPERSARERLTLAKAEREEIALALEREEVVSISVVLDDYRADMMNVRAGFLALPGRIAAVLPLPQAETVGLVEPVVHQVMDDLSRHGRLLERRREAVEAEGAVDDQDDEGAA